MGVEGGWFGKWCYDNMLGDGWVGGGEKFGL